MKPEHSDSLLDNSILTEPLDLFIQSAQIVQGDGVYAGGIGIHDGRITCLTEGTLSLPAREVIDVGGRYVMAGLIDPHVHMRDPGHTEKEDWLVGTRAAAAGGITTVLEHPNSIPPVNSVANLNLKKEIASSKAVVDFGLFGGAGETNIDSISELAEEGVIAFKTFLWPYPDRSEEFEGLYTVDDGVLYHLFRVVKETGRPYCVHAESYNLARYFTNHANTKGLKAPIHHEASRPVMVEKEACLRCMFIAHGIGVKLNLVHVSAGSIVSLVEHLRTIWDVNVTLETTPHHLLLTEERAREIGPYAKVNPPLRSQQEQELLWKHLRSGAIYTLGSDHAPHNYASKEPGWQDIFAAPAGATGIQTMLPTLLAKVKEGWLDLPTLTRLTSENVARLYGLYPRKGTIIPGADADLVVVDLDIEGTVDPTHLYSKDSRAARMFEGLPTAGGPVLTLVRGQVVMRDGEVLAEPGYGKFIRPI